MKEHGILDDSNSFGAIGSVVLGDFGIDKPNYMIGKFDLNKLV